MDKNYMKIAIKEATKALNNDDVPVGAVIVKNNKIIAKAYNKREKIKCVTAHAEIIAMEKACKKLGDWRLNGCIMYVTLQPCLMCRAALLESRIDKVIYATPNNNKGEQATPGSLFEETCELNVECEQLLKEFFKSKRK